MMIVKASKMMFLRHVNGVNLEDKIRNVGSYVNICEVSEYTTERESGISGCLSNCSFTIKEERPSKESRNGLNLLTGTDDITTLPLEGGKEEEEEYDAYKLLLVKPFL